MSDTLNGGKPHDASLTRRYQRLTFFSYRRTQARARLCSGTQAHQARRRPRYPGERGGGQRGLRLRRHTRESRFIPSMCPLPFPTKLTLLRRGHRSSLCNTAGEGSGRGELSRAPQTGRMNVPNGGDRGQTAESSEKGKAGKDLRGGPSCLLARSLQSGFERRS
ncbi:hypothetical protein VUR80DRAFT_1347 [Thermomyces stellatus]